MTSTFLESDLTESLPGDADRLAAIESEAAELESLSLSPAELSELALILSDAYQPLRGFMRREDYESVLETLCLANGCCFPLPVTLNVDLTTARTMEPGQRIALRDGEDLVIALLTVEDIWRRDPERESQLLGFDANGHGSCYLGGTVEGLRLPAHPFFSRLRPKPAKLAQHIRERGFNRVLAVDSAGLIHRRQHEIITRAAAELDAAVLLQPAVEPPDPGSLEQVVLIKSHLAVLPHFPRATTLLALLDYPARRAGMREFLLHARLRRRFGATHFMMKEISQRLIESDPRYSQCLDEIGIQAIAWPGGGKGAALTPTDAELRERIACGEAIPGNLTFPEVAAVLEAHYRPGKRRGFTLFFTGLSGSGKSTIAKIVQATLAERDARSVVLFHGDVMRKHFSKGLGLSREDHITNVRRIGAAAADITKGGGIAICCPIAPYAETRKAVRGVIEPHGAMIEIHVATPLAVCERRDPKGLYKKARAGRIQSFTGVSDPYEPPTDPELRLDASTGTPEDAAGTVIAHLKASGLIA